MNARTENQPEDLGNLALFRDLPAAQLQELLPLLHHKTFAAGATLMTVEQAGEVVYLILSGTVKVYAEHEDGARLARTHQQSHCRLQRTRLLL